MKAFGHSQISLILGPQLTNFFPMYSFWGYEESNESMILMLTIVAVEN
jgi:hypothetical protein